MENHLAEPMCLEFLAEAADDSPCRAWRLVKELVGVAPPGRPW